MRVERLELVDFRSYAAAAVQFAPGVAVLVGANAQGKTNLLEALHYVATGGSHRVSSDAPLVRAGASAAVIRVGAEVEGRRLTVELELRPGAAGVPGSTASRRRGCATSSARSGRCCSHPRT